MTSEIPYSQESELAVIGCMMLWPEEFLEKRDQLKEGDFFVPCCQRIFAQICKVANTGAELRNETLQPLLSKDDFLMLFEATGKYARKDALAKDVASVRADSRRRKRLEQLDLEKLTIQLREDDQREPDDSEIRLLLQDKMFDVSKPPQRTDPVIFVGDVGIAKPGDLVVIQAQIKSGKSSLLAAMMGCLMGSGRMDCDFLGLTG